MRSNFKFNFQIFQKQRDDNKLMGHGGHGIHVSLVGWDLGLAKPPHCYPNFHLVLKLDDLSTVLMARMVIINQECTQ